MTVLKCFSRLELRITPLSSYALPCHSPFQTIGLPSCQSETAVVPNIYCLIAAGFIRACQTFVFGALMTTDVFAIRSFFMLLCFDNFVSWRIHKFGDGL